MWNPDPWPSIWPEPLISRLTVAPTEEPLTVEEGKLRAGLDWLDGDPRDALMQAFISAARQRVEIDTGLALLPQTREVYSSGLTWVVELPDGCRPLTAVTGITYTDPLGVTQTVDPSTYTVDTARARLILNPGATWPYSPSFRNYALPFVITVTAGYADVAHLPPLLLQLVGLLTAHLATLGRDLATIDPAVIEVPYGYTRLVESFLQVSVA
jgi:uncharacterized phiE125 gp8 family phage protein